MASNWGSTRQSYCDSLLDPGIQFLRYTPDERLLPPEKTGLKVHEIIERLEQDGWQLVRTRGSHRQFRHSSKPGTVTVAGKPSMDLRLGTLNSILRQAGLK